MAHGTGSSVIAYALGTQMQSSASGCRNSSVATKNAALRRIIATATSRSNRPENTPNG